MTLAMPDLLTQDADSRAQAIDPRRSFLIEAPAGAGKTELLTQRFLALLAQVQEPEEVVALTFTNKAAAEMRERILGSLQRSARGETPAEPHRQTTFRLGLQVMAQDRARGWGLLAHPSRLQITTLDALCGRLVRQMPLLSRLGSQPAIATDPQPHYRQAVRDTLALLDTDHPVADALWRVLDRFDNDSARLQTQLIAMLASRDQWLRHSVQGVDLDAAEAALSDLIEDELARAAAVLTPDLQAQLMPLARFAANQVLVSQASGQPVPALQGITPLADWTEPLRPLASELPRWRALPALLLTQKGELRKMAPTNCGFNTPEGQALAKDFKALLQRLADAGAAPPLHALTRLPDPQYDADDRQFIGDLIAVLKVATAQLWLAFQQAREVDFTEMAQNALLALGDEAAPSELQLRLDYRISHLLVDEFQDTSPTQVELLRRLTAGWTPGDGRTLFLVGDPMQSIYKFRKADVGLFLKVRERGLGHLPLEALHLYRNNRSHTAVVDWVNATFPGVFSPRDDHHRGAVRFTEAIATRGAHALARVCWHPLVADDGTDADEASADDLSSSEREAQQVIHLVRQAQTESPDGTIAVLVRARRHLETLVAALRSAEPALPFQAVEIEALGERQVIQDLLSLTHALCHLGDRTHWLAVLRAPWCGLTLHDLHQLAADDHHSAVWTLIQAPERRARLSPDGQARLAHLHAVMAEALAHQGQQRPRRWIEGVWQALGGPWCLKQPAEWLDAQAFFETLDRCERQGTIDLNLLPQEVDKLFAAPDPQAGERLQLMTIHKSKGLEFDTVILPGLHGKPATTDRPLLLWDEVLDEHGQERLVVAAPPTRRDHDADTPSRFAFLQAFEAERHLHEARRLLYVAVTRARRQLHLLGTVQRSQRAASGLLSPPSGSLLGLLWHVAEPHFIALADALGSADANLSAPSTLPLSGYAHRLERLAQVGWPPAWQAAPPESLSASGRNALPPATGSDTRASGTGQPALASDLGRLVHRYLEIIALDGVAHWPPERVETLRPAMRLWLQAQGHGAAAARQAADEAADQLLTTLRSPQGRWVLAPHDEAASEWAITTWDDGQARTHVIDRTFIAEGIRWIIDYKTTRDDDADATVYREQLARYRRLFSEGPPVRMGIFFTHRGTFSEVSD